MSLKNIVTIDGPAGSGKSTVAAKVARKLGFLHLNSGLLYRAVAKAASARGVSYDSSEELGHLARSLKFDFHLSKGDFRTSFSVYDMYLQQSMDVDTLSAGEWSRGASRIATVYEVREVLTSFQKQLGSDCDLVLEGRDAGTVVFPDAKYKFYLTASLVERAKRRFLQQIKGTTSAGEFELVDLELNDGYLRVLEEMRLRDERDSSREHAPQMIPQGATIVETDGVGIDEVVARICSHVAATSDVE